MLHVILLILKILGIIFLVMIGLLLLILYAVFFSAVPYRIEVRKKEEDIRAMIFASWFFRVVTVRFLVDGGKDQEPVFQMRLFGYPLWQNVEEKSKWKRLKRFRKWLKKKFQSRWRRGKPERQAGPEPEKPVVEEAVRNTEKQPEHSAEKVSEEIPEPEKPRENHIPFSEQGKKYRFCNRVKQIWKKITGFRDGFRKILKRKDTLFEFWNLEEHRRARKAVLSEVCYLWKKLRPGKVRGRITFGFQDPADTGICMGVAGMFCAWYPKKLEIVPDFDRALLEGELIMKGKARFYVIVRVLWRIYKNEDIRHMYRHWQE